MDHDHAFKDLILDYPRQSIEFFAASLKWKPPPGAIFRPVRQEMLKERLPEGFLELDVPLEVLEPNGVTRLVVFDLEHVHDPARFRPDVLAKYCLDLGRLLKTSLVIPVVIVVGPGKFPKKLDLGIAGFRSLRFRFVWCHLAELPAKRYVDSNNIVARLNLTNMKHRRSNRIDLVNAAFEGLVSLEPDPNQKLKYRDFVEAYARLEEAEWREWRRRQPKQEAHVGVIKDYMDEREAKGRAEGRVEGLSEGRVEGEATTLLKVIEHRLRSGVLDPAGAEREIDEMVAIGGISSEAANRVRRALLPH